MEARESGSGPWLAVVGSTMIDQIAYAVRMPERGETVIGDRFAQGFGGKGANQAVMARLMGAEVAMVNAVGDDSYGTETIENFAASASTPRMSAAFPAPAASRPSGWSRMAATASSSSPAPTTGSCRSTAQPPSAEQPRVDAVIGQFEIRQDVTTAAFAAAHERGAITVLNPAPAAEISAELAVVTDWLIPNETEFGIIARAAGLSDDVDGSAGAGRLRGGPARAPAGHARRARRGHRRARTAMFSGCRLRRSRPSTPPGPVTPSWAPSSSASPRAGPRSAAVRLGCAIAAESVLRPGTQRSFPDQRALREIIAQCAGSAG